MANEDRHQKNVTPKQGDDFGRFRENVGREAYTSFMGYLGDLIAENRERDRPMRFSSGESQDFRNRRQF